MWSLEYRNGILFFFNSIVISIVIIQCAKKLSNIGLGGWLRKWILYIGQNTLPILLLNTTVLRTIDVLVGDRPILLEASLINSLIRTLIVLVSLMPVVWILNKYFPILVGKGRNISREKNTVSSEKPYTL